MSFKGLNYGELELDPEATTLLLRQQHHPLLKINYKSINNSIINKQDITIETNNEDLGQDDCMC